MTYILKQYETVSESENLYVYMYTEQIKCLTGYNTFSTLHLNIRSLNKHELASLISDSGCSFNKIGCSETWLNDKSYSNILNLEGYVLHYKNRSDRISGGVCLYVHSSMPVKVHDSLFVEVNINKNRNLIVGVIYFPLTPS